MLAFMIGRRYGQVLFERVISKKMYNKFMPILNGPYNNLILFLIFLIPEGPKGLVSYISGIAKVNAKGFILIATIARLQA